MDLELIINKGGIVTQAPSIEEIRARVRTSIEPTKLFYGETYDSYGNPIDSMKYYFFVSMLSRALKQEGFETNPSILIADVAACRNVPKNLNYTYMDLGEERSNFVQNVKDIYGLDIRIVKMSDYVFTENFQERLREIIEICKSRPELMNKIEKTVPESKRDIERKKEFAYSFDEIGTVIDLDIKVGPPREDLYDDVARDVANIQGKKGPLSLFLTPTFPLGKNWAYFFANEGIEDHGITAYKAGSKQLHENRIIIGKTTASEAERLINSSFFPKYPQLPNPILDIGIIAEMAKINLEGGEFNLHNRYVSGSMSETDLKKEALLLLNAYVLERFKNV